MISITFYFSEALLRIGNEKQHTFADHKSLRVGVYEDNENTCSHEAATQQCPANSFKAVQTAHSRQNFEGFPSHHKNSNDARIKEEVLEWWDRYRDIVKVKKWEQKLQRLAEKLKKPGVEERLKIKIENYLRRVPSYFSDFDEDSKDFRENLPNNIIKKLKKYYMVENKKHQTDGNTLEDDVSAYKNRVMASNYENVIEKWLKDITIEKKDISSRTVAKDDIVEFIIHRIEPLILNKPDFNAEFKYILKLTLINILKEIPIVIDSEDKKDFINRITDNLIDNLLQIHLRTMDRCKMINIGVNCNFDMHRLTPTEDDINDFIIDELTQLIKTSHVDINDQRIGTLRRELVKICMDALDCVSLNINKQDVIWVLQSIGNLNQYQAKHFASKLIKKLNDLLWSECENNDDKNKLSNYLTDSVRSNTVSTFNLKNEVRCDVSEIIYENYTTKIKSEIEKWMEQKHLSFFRDEHFKDTIIKNLVKSIVQIKGFNINNFEKVEYKVTKWIKKLVGNDIMQHLNIKDLVNRLTNASSFNTSTCAKELGCSVICQNVEVIPGPSLGRNLSYVEELIAIIFAWYHDLPYGLDTSVEAGVKSHSIKELAENIYTRIKSNENPTDVIDNEVNMWIRNFLQETPDPTLVTNLKNKVNNVDFRLKKTDNEDMEQNILKKYEESISDWYDKLVKDPNQKELFAQSKNALVAELARRLYEIKRTLGESSKNVIIKKMRNDVSEWLIKVHILPAYNIKQMRDKMANKLIEVIQECDAPIDDREKKKLDFEEITLKRDIIEWLEKQPFYIENNADEKIRQEIYTTELADILLRIKQGSLLLNVDEELAKYVEKLKHCDNDTQHVVAELKQLFEHHDTPIHEENENEEMTTGIENWLKTLPLNILTEQDNNVTDCLVKELLVVITMQKNTNEDSQSLIETIKKMIKLLPIDCKTKCNETFLNHHAKRLLQQLNIINTIDLNGNENSGLNLAENNEVDIDDPKANDYMRQLMEHIEEWLTSLKLPLQKEKGLRTVVVNELAEDIIDREKYLKMNPSSRGTNIEEIDHLKFQIFKWINKLVGEKNLATVEHAPELMQRIKSIPGFMPTTADKRNTGYIARQSLGAGPSLYGIRKQGNIDVKAMPMFGRNGPGGSVTEGMNRVNNNRRYSNPLGYPIDYVPKSNRNIASGSPIANAEHFSNVNQIDQINDNNSKSRTILRPLPDQQTVTSVRVSLVPEGTTVQQIYQHYEEVFKKRVNEIPFDLSTPEEQTLANLIKQGLINIIWNTYFKLKSNRAVENDYRIFEIWLEEALDEVLNDLPETIAIQRIKPAWKVRILEDVISMLRKVHSVTDTRLTKKRVAKGEKRDVVLADILEFYEQKRHDAIIDIIDKYLKYRKYNEEDLLKSKIFEHRLFKYISYVIDQVSYFSLSKEEYEIFWSKLVTELDKISIPDNDLHPNEVNEAEIGLVVQEWFNELPYTATELVEIQEFQNRQTFLLMQKLNLLERNIYENDSELERALMHEICLFLTKPGILLQPDSDLQIFEMAQKLADRLKARRQVDIVPVYESFAENKPLSSSIIQVNPNPRLRKKKAPVEPIVIPTRITDPARTAPLSPQRAQPNQRSVLAAPEQQPVMVHADLVDQHGPTVQDVVDNGEMIIQPQVFTSIHEQIGTNPNGRSGSIVHTIMDTVTADVPGNTIRVIPPGTPIQILEASNLSHPSIPALVLDNQNIQVVQTDVASPRHNISYVPVSNIPDPDFIRQQVVNKYSVQGTAATRPVEIHNSGVERQPAVPPAELTREQIEAIRSPEFVTNSKPTLSHRTESTARIGDNANELEQQRKDSRRMRCTCVERCNCNRRKCICYCEIEDDEEDVCYVPCKYYY